MFGLFNPMAMKIGLVVIALALMVGSYKAGYNHAQSALVAKQLKADAEESAKIRERIENALEKIGVDPSDDDVERLLRELAGE